MRRRGRIPSRAALLGVVPFLFAAPLSAQTSHGLCRSPGSGISVDHVVIAVSDLDRAAADFQSLGFTLKPGRLHPNGLLNAHVKFADGTALELISPTGKPTDPVAVAYANFLRAGDGGAFLAIGAAPDRVTEAARELGLPSQLERSGPFTWVTVDDSRGNPDVEPSPLFFVAYLDRPDDPDSLLVHHAGAVGIGSVLLDTTGALAELLTLLGASECSIEGENAPPSRAVLGLANAELVLRLESTRGRNRREVGQVTLLAAPGTLMTGPHVMDEQRTHGIGLLLDASE